MDLSSIVRRMLSTTVLSMGFLLMTAACQTAAPTPTPEPELSVDDLLLSVGEKLADISTAKFQMIDEMESGAQFFGTTLKNVEGEIRSPDSVRMLVSAESPALGFVEIEMRVVGDQAYMKFSKDAPWLPLPIDQVPFNFGEIGITLSRLMPIIRDVAITGRESVQGGQTIRMDGSIVSEELSDLITYVDSGHPITLTLWVDEVEHALRQFRADGKLFDDDAPETSRLVIITGIDVPVDVQLPEIASQP